MKIFLSILWLFSATLVWAQTAEEHYKNGLAKHSKHDFEGAIADYNKAIKSDRKNHDIYYNRGTCALALKDYRSAQKDFDKTIKLDPNFVKAYYNRATIFVSQKRYKEALPDLDKVVELNEIFPNGLTLRGQIRVQTGNAEGGCADFERAQELGISEAEAYLVKHCGAAPAKQEQLLCTWPKNWKIGDRQENEKLIVVDYIPKEENFDNWTELGNITTIKGFTNAPVEKMMGMLFEESQKKSPKCILTFIEKNETAEYPWILFTIESPQIEGKTLPESQLWYIVQGKKALYTSFRAIKKAQISTELKEKWGSFFKASQIVEE